jgi:hypothetical protein
MYQIEGKNGRRKISKTHLKHGDKLTIEAKIANQSLVVYFSIIRKGSMLYFNKTEKKHLLSSRPFNGSFKDIDAEMLNLLRLVVLLNNFDLSNFKMCYKKCLTAYYSCVVKHVTS